MRPQAHFGDLLRGTTVRNPLASRPFEELARRAAELAAGYREDRIEIWLQSLLQEAAEEKSRRGIGDEVRQDRDAPVLQLHLGLRCHRVVRGFDQQAAGDAGLVVGADRVPDRRWDHDVDRMAEPGGLWFATCSGLEALPVDATVAVADREQVGHVEAALVDDGPLDVGYHGDAGPG